MMASVRRRSLLGALAFLGAGAGTASALDAVKNEGAAGGAEVFIDNFTFAPAELRVAVGTKVTWTNRDDIPHTVTDAVRPRELRSPVLDTGDSWARSFPEKGSFRYFCSLHPHMEGTVVVT